MQTKQQCPVDLFVDDEIGHLRRHHHHPLA
jgi:hypothetical protein